MKTRKDTNGLVEIPPCLWKFLKNGDNVWVKTNLSDLAHKAVVDFLDRDEDLHINCESVNVPQWLANNNESENIFAKPTSKVLTRLSQHIQQVEQELLNEMSSLEGRLDALYRLQCDLTPTEGT